MIKPSATTPSGPPSFIRMLLLSPVTAFIGASALTALVYAVIPS